MMEFRVLIALCSVATLFTSAKPARAAEAKNLQAAGEYLGGQVADFLGHADSGSAQILLAVFKFGDDHDEVSRKLGMAPTQLQGHIIQELERKFKADTALGNRFSVLDVDALDQRISNSVSVRFNDPAFTRVKLSQKGIGACLLGTLIENQAGGYTCTVKVVLPGEVSSPIQLDIRKTGIEPFTPTGGSTKLSGRFNVELFAQAKGSSTFQELELRQAKDQSGEFRNALLVSIDRAKYFGQPFQIRLTNFKDKSVAIPKADVVAGNNDKDRVFGAAVFLDGVSSAYIQDGSTWRKDIRHPAYVGKHLLTADDKKFVPNSTLPANSRFGKAELVSVSPPNDGHSTWLIEGFQKDQLAAQFLFGSAAQSVGAGMGQNVNQIGLISVYFYAEVMDDDQAQARAYAGVPEDIGIISGPDMPSPVTIAYVKDYYPFPAEVWHIQYMYSDDPENPPLGPPIQPGS